MTSHPTSRPAPVNGPDRDARVTAPLPENAPVLPPVTARKLGRFLTVVLLLWLAGAVTLAIPASPAWTAAAIGLGTPGGGLAWLGHPVAAVTAAALLALSVVVWWTIGVTVLPPLVWIATVVWGALAAPEGPAVPAVPGSAVLSVVPGLVTVLATIHLVRHRLQVRRGRLLNQELSRTTFLITGPPQLETRYPVQESSPEDLQHLRYALDLALQPVDTFDGFLRLDQFREGALRYAIYLLGYGLSMAQFTRTPAFGGYLEEAQRSAIEKVLNRRVWGYWAIENAWGNLRLNRDPVSCDENVMLTGYHALQVSMYAALNGDRFSVPNSLTYRWNDSESYGHDLGSLTAALERNMRASAYTIFPCEPNWVYPICNAYGVNALIGHDRQHGSDYFAGLRDPLHQAYEREFLRPDGTIIGVRSTHLGLSWNFWAGPTIQLATAYWLHASFPEIAHRTWWLLRRSYLGRTPDGLLRTPWSASGRLDPGSYVVGRDTYTVVATLAAARELGDDEWAGIAEKTLQQRVPVEEAGGARRYAKTSPLTNCWSNLARFGRHSAMRDLIVHGVPDTWRLGPRLVAAPYPEVLVARAVTDGQALDLVLRPGAAPARVQLTLDRLRPNHPYRVLGALDDAVTSDATGRARITVDLDGRRVVRIH